MMSHQVNSADRIDSKAQSTAGRGGRVFLGVACILQESSCFTSIKAIYVSHCALEVVRRQSSLICLSSLTHRLALASAMECLYSTMYLKEAEKRQDR